MAMKLVIAMLLLSTAIASAKKLPPPPVEAKIVKIAISGGDTVVTVAAGSETGIDKNQACAFYGAKHKPIAGACTLIRVDKTTAIVKTQLTRDEVTGATVKIGYGVHP